MKSVILEKFKQGSFARDVLTLFTGTTIAQALSIIASPILTRLYLPEDFGVMALYLSIAGILSVAACWRYEFAIVIPEDDKDAANILIMSVIISIGMSLLVLIAVIFFSETFANWLGASELALWLWLLPISFFLLGLYQAFNYWSTRKKQFKHLSNFRVSQAATKVGCQVGFGALTNFGAVGLLGGYLFGQFVGTGVLIGQTLRDDCKKILAACSRTIMAKQALKYRKYPVYEIWPSVLNNFAVLAPALFLMKFFDVTTVGFFALSIHVLEMPMQSIGTSFSQVFFQRITDEYNKTGTIQYLVKKAFKRLFLFSLPILAVMLFAPTLFEIIFGAGWRTAGEYARILSPAFVVKFVTSPLSIVFYTLNRQELAAAWKVIAGICTPAFLFISLWFDHPLYSIIFLSINYIFLYLLYLMMIFKVSGVIVKDILK